MKSSAVVLPYLLPRAALECGNVVSDYKRPNQGKFRSTQNAPSLGNGIMVSGLSNMRDLQTKERGIGLSVILSRLFKIDMGADSQGRLSLATKTVITYLLDDSDSVFANLCKDEAFQTWFEKTAKKKDMHLAVGMQTVADAVFGLDSELVRNAAAGFQVPTPQPGLEAEARARAHANRSRDTQFQADNEQIYAVLYRKIVFDTFGAADLARASLGKRESWRSTFKSRGASEDEIAVRLAQFEADGSLGVVASFPEFEVMAEVT